MVSIDEVASAAGVSTATVSRAISGRGHVSSVTKERVLSAAKALGYVVSSSASSLASGRTRNVGVIVPFLDRWFFSTVLSGLASAVTRAGYDITLYNITDDAKAREKIFGTFLRRGRVDAVIAVSIHLEEDEVETLLHLDIPVVAIGGPNQRLPTLAVDDFAVAQLATQHLLDLGHTAIAHVGASPEYDLDFHVPTSRRLGFEHALRTAGISLSADKYEPADFTVDGGFQAATRLLTRETDRPTAIFAGSDEMAIGAILAARELGFVVARDLSIIGIDGHDLGRLFRLTTVDQFPSAQGERAVSAIFDALNSEGPGPTAPMQGELPFRLVVRESTGKAPQ